MKLNYWLIIGAMLSTSLLAQQATNLIPTAPPPPAPATPAPTLAPAPAETNAPAAKTGKKKSAKKQSGKKSEKQAAKKGEKQAAAKKPAAKKAEPMAALKTTPLAPGPAMVVASNVNVRGQAKLKSEVVTRVTKGATVTVLEEIVNNNSGPEEPSAWAKILLPPGAHVWANTLFIDTNNFTVRAKKLNLRTGPGENYSVAGLLQKGDAVKELKAKGEWIEIEPPANAYAFIAAAYLSQEAPELAAATPKPAAPTTPMESTPKPAAPVTPPPPPEPTPTPTTVATAPTVAPPPTAAPSVPTPAVTPPKAPPVEMPVVTTPTVPAMTEPEVPTEPPPPRIVQREGIVRGMTSIVAPSRFVLISPENHKDIDYLYSTSPDLDLRRYKGVRVIVTGEEGLDDRWGNTPVLTIQKIQPVREE
jgi:uncharacterized protein YgiM (DUF1202 family)